MASVSVIIPTYQRPEWLQRCLAALTRQKTDADFEVIVVDDGSPDRAANEFLVASFQGRINVAYFYYAHRGQIPCLNSGLSRATGEIICILDDDSIPQPCWIEQIRASFAADPRVGIVNGKTISINRDTKSLAYLLEQTVYLPRKKWAASNVAYRRQALTQVGGFDEHYRRLRWYWADNDAGLRVEWSGWRHVYNPGAVIEHNHDSTLGALIRTSKLNGYGFSLFFKKFYFSKFFFVHGVFLWIVKDLVRFFLPGLRHRVRFIWSYYSLVGFLKGLFIAYE